MAVKLQHLFSVNLSSVVKVKPHGDMYVLLIHIESVGSSRHRFGIAEYVYPEGNYKDVLEML